ncbi:type II toxin-antitoxin system RelE/ParE family toxin [Candidatus Parcubacteria bacterium]|nr:type II toxin-antitoxin system RelE/ParE family toxin [Candidatus Parcubacteria bacterium]
MFTADYHPKVEKDLKKIAKTDLELIEKIIVAKLFSRPQLYGKNLRGSLKDYRGLRILKYRVIFKIVRKKVYILAIGHRQEIYQEALKRVF